MKSILSILRFFHAALQSVIIAFFYYQGWLGLRIRTRRKKGELAPGAMKTHRRNGPRIALFLIAGYLLGLFIVYLAGEDPFAHPLHFLNGSLLVLLVSIQYLVSRHIKGRGDSFWRNIHLINGISILFFLLVQFALGLRIFLAHDKVHAFH